MAEELFIIGTDGLAREINAALTHPDLQKQFLVKGFIDDRLPPGDTVNGTPIAGDREWLRQKDQPNVIIGEDKMEKRQMILEELVDEVNYPTIIHPDAKIEDKNHVHIGKGVFIGPFAYLTTNIEVGDFCILYGGCSLHYDMALGENCIVMPGTHLYGGYKIEDNNIVQ